MNVFNELDGDYDHGHSADMLNGERSPWHPFPPQNEYCSLAGFRIYIYTYNILGRKLNESEKYAYILQKKNSDVHCTF